MLAETGAMMEFLTWLLAERGWMWTVWAGSKDFSAVFKKNIWDTLDKHLVGSLFVSLTQRSVYGWYWMAGSNFFLLSSLVMSFYPESMGLSENRAPRIFVVNASLGQAG